MPTAGTYTFDSPYGIYPPTELSTWIRMEETLPGQESSTTNRNNDIAPKPPSSIAINNNSTTQPTSTTDNHSTTDSSSFISTSDNTTIQPFSTTTIMNRSNSLSFPTTLNNFSLQFPVTRDIIRLLILTLTKGINMTYLGQDLSIQRKFLIFDFQALLEDMKNSMTKCYEVFKDDNTTSYISALVKCTENGKNIEKDISEFVSECCGNEDSLEDIIAEAEIF